MPLVKSATGIVFFVYRILPAKVRYAVKGRFGASGHRSSKLDALKATRDARGKKRIDRTVGRLVAMLREVEITSLEGCRCLDFGAGYVPSDAVGLYLLGAHKVTSVDLNPIMKVSSLRDACKSVNLATLALAADNYCSWEGLSARWNHLSAMLKGSDPTLGLKAVNLHYLAPFDASAEEFPDQYDLVYSVSVLEHLPALLVGPILASIYRSIAPGGTMVHDIHLEDHLDMDDNPHEFLLKASAYVEGVDSDRRGNRLRVSDWVEAIRALPGAKVTITSQDGPRRVPPPASMLLPQFLPYSVDDCFVSRVTVSAQKDS